MVRGNCHCRRRIVAARAVAMVFQGVKNAVKSRIRDLIDSEITKQARPFMEMGVGPDGQDCSDIVINEDLDISIENMIVKTSLVNETLMKQSSPFRVSMVSAKRIFCLLYTSPSPRDS